MKSFLFCILGLLMSFSAFGQLKMNNITRHDLNRLQSKWRMASNSEKEVFRLEFPIYSMNKSEIISLLGEVDSNFDAQSLPDGIRIGSRIGKIVTLKVTLNQLAQIYLVDGLKFVEIAPKTRPLLDRVVKDIYADSVHLGIDLPQPYSGKEVFIGVTDWGFDYTHPMFYDTAMNELRIFAAWDQYKLSGPSPAGFSYGTEYASIPELLAAGSDTSNIYSYSYHGSHVAGIAGGGGAGTIYRGVAYDANFLFTTFLVDAGAVLDAYQWMYQKSQQSGKRLVINQSWGLHHIGNLDGTSLLSQAIDQYSDLGVVFSSSGGNNGDVNFHLQKTFSGDTLRSKVDFYSYAANQNMWGQSISCWGEPNQSFSASFRVMTSTNQVLASIPFYSTETTSDYIEDSLFIGQDTLIYNLSADQANLQNNRPHIRLRIKNKNTSYRIILQLTANTGTVHAWNVTELVTDVGNWGMPFSISGAGTVAGNKNYGISEPACTESTIAVAAYAASYTTPGGTNLGGTIAGFSSVGPTLDGRVKPDISAPGVSVGSSVSSFSDASYSTTTSVLFEGENYPFTKISGTSMAAPVVSGVVALILEANPFLSVDQVKTCIFETAREDLKTGVIPEIGSLQWGFGKINAHAAVKKALTLVDLSSIAKDEFRVYPNPAQNQITITGDLKNNESVEIYSLDGKLISTFQLTSNTIEIDDLVPGFYFLTFKQPAGIVKVAFVKS